MRRFVWDCLGIVAATAGMLWGASLLDGTAAMIASAVAISLGTVTLTLTIVAAVIGSALDRRNR